MKAFSIISSFFLAAFVMIPTNVAGEPGILTRMNAITNGGAVNATTLSVLNFYLNFGEQEYDDEIIGGGNSRKKERRQLRRGHDDEDEQKARHLLTCYQCKQIYGYNWCATVRNECRRRELTLAQYMATNTNTIPTGTVAPTADFNNCRQLTPSAGIAAINAYAAANSFTFPSGMGPAQTNTTVFVCDEDD